MASSTVFITGATGFIGAQVVAATLKAGYNVRLSVRREAQIARLREVFGDFSSQLDFVVIPDYTADRAFDAALEGVEYIIHLASPLAKPDEDVVTPAVKGTVAILTAADRCPLVKKVVITASVVSLIPLGKGGEEVKVTEDIPREQLSFDTSIIPTLPPMAQYAASKLAAHTATLDHISTHNPHYSVVTLHPVFVFGHNLLQKIPEELTGTNGMLFSSLCAETPTFAPFCGVHVLDVAEAHVRALGIEDKPVESFLLAAKRRSWEEVLGFVKREFPDAEEFKARATSGDGWNVDATRAKTGLGFERWREMEVQVRDVVSQQLRLRGGGGV